MSPDGGVSDYCFEVGAVFVQRDVLLLGACGEAGVVGAEEDELVVGLSVSCGGGVEVKGGEGYMILEMIALERRDEKARGYLPLYIVFDLQYTGLWPRMGLE